MDGSPPESMSAGKKRGLGPAGTAIGLRIHGASWKPYASRNEMPMAVMSAVSRGLCAAAGRRSAR